MGYKSGFPSAIGARVIEMVFLDWGKLLPDMQATSVLKRTVSHRSRRGDTQETRHALEEAGALLSVFLMKQPAFWAAQYDSLVDTRFNAVDKSQHDLLAERGQRAIRENDVDGLRQVVIEMYQNTIRAASDSDTNVLSGLMK